MEILAKQGILEMTTSSKQRRLSNEYLNRLNALKPPRRFKFNLVSFFCGGGGLDLGLYLSGFKPLFANDIEHHLCETISQNIKGCVDHVKDITELSGKIIRKLSKVDSIDLVAGGPPCQAFSILGQRNSFQDPRGQLVYEYIRIIRELKPKAFVFENVPGIQTLNGGNDWAELLSFFKKELKYKLFSEVLNSADYGIPQIRKRIFIIGFQDKSINFEFPALTHYNPTSKSLSTNKLLNWLPSKLALEHLEDCKNHRLRIHGDRVRGRYEKVPQGGRDKVDHTDRIHPEKPSGTVLVGSRAGGGRPFIHPYEPRHITVREAARLQSFPDWYVFHSPETWQYRAVGNAVPPILAMVIGKSILKALKE